MKKLCPKVGLIFLFAFVILSSQLEFLQTGLAADKLRFGVGFAWAPPYVLLEVAAREQGFWKKQGLEVEWKGFLGGADMVRALAAEALDMGTGDVVGFILGVSQGVPMVIVAHWPQDLDYHIWVLKNSRLREPRDLKGGKIGVFRVPSTTSALAMVAVKAAGLGAKDVKLVGVGGQPERVATLKSGVVDGFVQATSSNVDLIARDEIRSLININDHLPKDWVEGAIFSRKRFMEQNPKVVERALVAISQAIDFVRNNRVPWAVEKVKSQLRFTTEGARLAVDEKLLFQPGAPREFNKKALENVIEFYGSYRVIDKDKVPPLDSIINIPKVGG